MFSETDRYLSMEHLDYQLNIVLTQIARDLVTEDLNCMKYLLTGNSLHFLKRNKREDREEIDIYV